METIMKALVLTIVFLQHHAAAWEQYDKCDMDFEKVGCYSDLNHDRALPSELLNERDTSNPNYDGHTIDWNKFPEYISGLACRCAAKAREEGHQYFGLQYYGECWSGHGDYKKHGKAEPDTCIPDYNQQCVDANKDVCVGAGSVNYVYKLRTCPTGWSYDDGSCYRTTSTVKTWDNAHDDCKSMGGKLATIDSSKENAFVAKIAKARFPWHTNLWLGLHRDSSSKSGWIGFSSHYSNWASGEPNSSAEKCGMMYIKHHSKQGKWNDAYCSLKMVAMCERVVAG